MVPFSYQAAVSASQAVSAAAGGGRFIAGGTDLIGLMREEIERPQALVDINQLPLRGIEMRPDGLAIGALARMSDVAAHPFVKREHPLIREALLEAASPQLRNAASIGGNLLQRVRCPYFRTPGTPCNKRQPASGCAAIDGFHRVHAIFGTSPQCIAAHPSDLAVALVALDARVRVRGTNGGREFPMEDLYRLPGETPHLEYTIAQDELIVEVLVRGSSRTRRTKYLKTRDRASYDFALVSVAVSLDIVDARVRDARLSAGGVGARPWRLRSAETALIGQPAGRHAWEHASERALDGAHPLPGNSYKLKLLQQSVIRALELAGEAS